MSSRSLREPPGVNTPDSGTSADIGGLGTIDRKRVWRALGGALAGLAVGVLIGFAGLGVVLSLVLLWLVATACAAFYILRSAQRRPR